MVLLDDSKRGWDISWLEEFGDAPQEIGENENKPMYYNRAGLESTVSEDKFNRCFKGNNDYELAYRRIIEK